MGHNAYKARDYVDAAVYLYAYIQTTPQLSSSDPGHLAQVQTAYDFSVQQARQAVVDRDNLRLQLASQPHDGVGSTVSGITIAPPPLDPPRRGAVMGAVFVNPNPIAGVWKYEMTSNEGGGVHQGTLTLSVQKSAVRGEIDTWDNSSKTVTGNWSNGVLELTRDTGLETVQHYTITVEGGTGKGTFQNTGRYHDSGTIVLTR